MSRKPNKRKQWTTTDARKAADSMSRKAAARSKRAGERVTWSGVPGDTLKGGR